MLRATSLTRRDVVTGFAAGITAHLTPRSLFAQVPPPRIATNPAHALRDTLAVAPITSYEGVLLEPVPWVGTSLSPYLSSVGGVHVLITDRSAAPFGSYVVYLDEQAAHAGAFLGKRALEPHTIQTRATAIAGYTGDVIAHKDDGSHAIVLVPIGNVLVIANDTVVETRDESGYEDNEARALDHAEVLIGHLLGVIERRS